MLTAALAFFIALAIASILTPIVRDVAIAKRWSLRDKTYRDVHSGHIPRLGGVAIVVAFLAPLVGLMLVESGPGNAFHSQNHYVIALFGGGLAIALLGIYDDIRGADALQKLVVQAAVALTIWGLGIRIDKINWFGAEVDFGDWSIVITTLWIVGVINAMNLIDGLDGLASGVAFVAILPNLVVSIYSGNVLMMLFMASLAGAILGFLMYNFRPASVFMGDTGSMFLGFVVATSSIIANTKASATVSMATPILALGLPILDTMLAIFRRGASRQPLFTADKDHVHHKLLGAGLSHRQAVLVLYAVCGFFALAALASAFVEGVPAAVLLLVVTVSIAIFMFKVTYLARDHGPQTNREARSVVRKTRQDIRRAQSSAEVWFRIQPLREQLAVDEFSLVLGHETHVWRRQARKESDRRGVVFGVDLVLDGATIGEVKASWLDGRSAVVRDDEIAIELLAEALMDAAQHLLDRPKRGEEADIIPLRRMDG